MSRRITLISKLSTDLDDTSIQFARPHKQKEGSNYRGLSPKAPNAGYMDGPNEEGPRQEEDRAKGYTGPAGRRRRDEWV